MNVLHEADQRCCRHPHDVSSNQQGAHQLIKESPSQESLSQGQQLSVERSKDGASNWRCSVDGKQLIVKNRKSNNSWRGWLEWYPCVAIWIGICTYCDGRAAELLATFPLPPAISVALGCAGAGVVTYVADCLPRFLSGITKLAAMLLLTVWATYLVCVFITWLHHTLHGWADGSGGRSLAGQDWNILLESESDTAQCTQCQTGLLAVCNCATVN